APAYPGCTSQGQYGDNSKGELVDFQICQNDADWTTEMGNGYQSCYDVMWDDAEYGWDYELDIRYRIYVKTGAGTITVKTKGLSASAGHLDYAGYIISGVVNPGEYLDIACGRSSSGGAGSTDCDKYNVITTSDGAMPNATDYFERTFTVTGSTSGFLKDPLWYAAKYGAFNDVNSNGIPDLQKEWDKDNNGTPDTYFYAANPLKLETKLTEALADILSKTSSGTSVSVLATSSGGEGAIYQAYFYPSIFEGNNEISWLGYHHGLFFDSLGQLREDSDQDGRLLFSGAGADKVVETFFDSLNLETRVRRYSVDSNGKKTGVPDIIRMEDMKPIWEGGKKLAERDLSTNPRVIKTWVDQDGDGVVDPGEVIDFTPGNEPTLRPYLRAANPVEGNDMINYIRGGAVSGYRPREVKIGGVDRTWRLGDIIYSSPVSVGAPQEQFDKKYRDESYTPFYQKYSKRRHVVYVGANDGMLHAFNGGFFHPGDDLTTGTSGSPVVEHGWFTTNPTGNTPGDKPLGEELWGFIPQELLPHLKWLTQTDYDKSKHIYYVDGSPRITDAQIFTEEAACATNVNDPLCIHPKGWGTVLIGSMRMGGGMIKADLNGNGIDTDPGEDRFRSAYFALDITNPEGDPKLLWVFKDSDLGFTTGWPAIMRFKAGNSDNWYVVFGSGPTTYRGERTDGLPTVNLGNKFGSAISEYGWVYAVDFKTGALVPSGKILVDGSIPTDQHAFMGDPVVYDLPKDSTEPKTDILYIGKTYGSFGAGGWNGKVHRIVTKGSSDPTNWEVSVLFNPQKPVLVKPTATMVSGRLWIYFGTGRFFSNGVGSDQVDTSAQALYGIKESSPNGCWDKGVANWKTTTCPTVLGSDLVDVTSVSVLKTGIITPTVSGATTLSDLVNNVINNTTSEKAGWVLNLAGGERVLHESTILGGIVSATTYKPNSDICLLQGTNAVYAMHVEAGTAFPSTDRNDADGDGDVTEVVGVIGIEADNITVTRKKDLGVGVASKVNIVVSGNTTTGFVQSSTGEILQIKGINTASSVRQGTKLFREKSD
ncbi:MAG: hypothetical protein WAO55_02225, partial [Candidatus Manganitrophaceae bacterium]